jgi:hypothetical protein
MGATPSLRVMNRIRIQYTYRLSSIVLVGLWSEGHSLYILTPGVRKRCPIPLAVWVPNQVRIDPMKPIESQTESPNE